MKSIKKLKVAIIEPVGGHGGMNYYDVGLCSGVGHAGIEVTLYTCDKNPPVSVPGVFNVKATFRGVYGTAPAWQRGLRYVRALIIALVQERTMGSKIVHFHFFHVGLLEFLGVILARCLAFRVVVTAHDVESFKENLSIAILVKWTYDMANAVIAHNRTSANEVKNKLGVEESRIHIVPHGSYVDFVEKLIPRQQALELIGLPLRAKQVILFFGQIKEVKGLDLLIEAFSLIYKDYPNAQLVIAGRVWKDNYLKYQNLIVERGIEDQVNSHIRYIADDEVGTFYSAADVVVLPYRRIYQSGVLLMAMSYGIPVITSDLDAMKEIVDDRDNGFLFKSGDYVDLACVLRGVLIDEDIRHQAAKNALTKMEDDFNWLGIGKKIAQIYSGLAI